MAHQVRRIKVVAKQGRFLIQAQGQSPRGTYFTVDSLEVGTDGLSKTAVRTGLATAVSALVPTKEAVQ